jgi:hypothetical protein
MIDCATNELQQNAAEYNNNYWKIRTPTVSYSVAQCGRWGILCMVVCAVGYEHVRSDIFVMRYCRRNVVGTGGILNNLTMKDTFSVL